jgi:copper chaperone CopZ
MVAKQSGRETPRPAVGVVHHTPGRTRLRVAQAHRTPRVIGELEATLRTVPGVQRVETNVATGSILLTHDRNAIAEEDISKALDAATSLALDMVPPRFRNEASLEMSDLARGIAATFKTIDLRVAQATDGWIDLKMLVPVLLLGAAVAQATVAEGAWAAVPPYVLAYYAFDTFIKFHGSPAAIRLAPNPSAS